MYECYWSNCGYGIWTLTVWNFLSKVLERPKVRAYFDYKEYWMSSFSITNNYVIYIIYNNVQALSEFSIKFTNAVSHLPQRLMIVWNSIVNKNYRRVQIVLEAAMRQGSIVVEYLLRIQHGHEVEFKQDIIDKVWVTTYQ